MSELIEIIPLDGIKIGNRHIKLLDSKEKVESALGIPMFKREHSYFYFDNELRIDFNEQSLVEFIEFLGGIDGKIQPRIYGVGAFEEKADILYDLLKDKNAGGIDDSEKEYCYSFLNISVGIFREYTPEDVLKCIQEMRNEAESGKEPIAEEDIEYEIQKASHWDTIGIGVKGYYQ